MFRSQSPSGSARTAAYQVSWAVVAGLFGAVLNLYPSRPFSEIVVLHGNWVALLISACYGPLYGLLSAILATAPAAWPGSLRVPMIALAAEATVLGLLVRRGFSLWTGGLLFWLGVTVPAAIVLGFRTEWTPGGWAGLVVFPLHGMLSIAIAEVVLLVPAVRALLAVRAEPRPLRANLFSVFMAVGALPLLVGSALTLRHYVTIRASQDLDHSHQLAVAIGEAVEDHIDTHLRAMSVLAADLESRADFERSSLASTLARHHRLYDSFLTLLAADATGTVQATAGLGIRPAVAGTPPQTIRDREYWREAFERNHPFVSDVFQGRGLGGDPIVAISVPVRTDGGRPWGIVEGSLNIDRFREAGQHSRGPGDRVIVLDARQRVVYSSDPQYAPLSDIGDSGLVRAAQKVGAGTSFRFRSGGQSYFAGHTETRRRWRVFVLTSVTPLLADSDRYFVSAGLGVLAMMCMCLVMAKMAAGRVTRPLERLADHLSEASPGQLALAPLTPPAESSREVVRVVTAFDQMSERLDRSYAELAREQEVSAGLNGRLQDLLSELDAKVRDRTEQLEKANRLLLAVIESSPLAIMMVDSSGGMSIWNPAAARILGWSHDEVRACLPEGFGPETPEFGELLRRARDGFEASGWVSRWRCKDGSRIDMSAGVSSLRDSAGAVSGVVILAADMTEQVRLEAHLRQTQKLEAVGRLAGGVAHDFNNLLTVINGFSELAMDSLPPASDAARKLALVVKAGHSAAAITSQLLAFSRRQTVQPTVIDLRAQVGQMEGMLARVVGENINLVIRHHGPIPWVLSDRPQMEQVVLNLITNARDAMPAGGTVEIETGVEIGPAEPGRPQVPAAFLSVSDTGHGMDGATQARIFEPFFTTREIGKGTGLGLSTVHGIVQQSRGRIEVESAPGAGTRFRIWFPLADAPSREGAPGVEQPGLPSPGTVLVVEDNDSVRKLVRHYLEQAGYRVLETGSLAEALDVVRRESGVIDLLLSDVIMPDGNGPDVWRAVTRVRPGLPALFMSGHTWDRIAGHGLLDEGAELISKPFTGADLTARVRQILLGQPAAR